MPGLTPSPKDGGADSPHPAPWSSWRDNAPRFDEAVEMAVVSLPRIPEEEALAKTRPMRGPQVLARRKRKIRVRRRADRPVTRARSRSRRYTALIRPRWCGSHRGVLMIEYIQAEQRVAGGLTETFLCPLDGEAVPCDHNGLAAFDRIRYRCLRDPAMRARRSSRARHQREQAHQHQHRIPQLRKGAHRAVAGGKLGAHPVELQTVT